MNLYRVYDFAKCNRWNNVSAASSEEAIAKIQGVTPDNNPGCSDGKHWVCGPYTTMDMRDVTTSDIAFIGLKNFNIFNQDNGIAKMVERFTVAELEHALLVYNENMEVGGVEFDDKRSHGKNCSVRQQILGAIKIIKNKEQKTGQVEMLELLGAF